MQKFYFYLTGLIALGTSIGLLYLAIFKTHIY